MLGEINGCEVIACAMVWHRSDAAVVERALICVRNLSGNEQNETRFTGLDMCSLTLEALSVFIEHTAIAEQVSHAV